MSGAPEKVEQKNFRFLSNFSHLRVFAQIIRCVYHRNLAVLDHNCSCNSRHYYRFPHLEIYTGCQKMVEKEGVGDET